MEHGSWSVPRMEHMPIDYLYRPDRYKVNIDTDISVIWNHHLLETLGYVTSGHGGTGEKI